MVNYTTNLHVVSCGSSLDQILLLAAHRWRQQDRAFASVLRAAGRDDMPIGDQMRLTGMDFADILAVLERHQGDRA